MFELKGKVALVTGGVSGIGLQTVRELLKNDIKGVTIADINEACGTNLIKELENEFGQKAIFVKVNIADRAEFEEAFKETVKIFGNLDVVINAAGILDDSQWEKEISININGCVNGNLLALDYLEKHRCGSEGVILNIASIASISVNGFIPVYNATKHAVLGLSRSFGLNRHYNSIKIKVISVCPGPTTTPLTDYEKGFKWLGTHYQDMHLVAKLQMQYQSPSHVAEGIVKIIGVGESGSIWVIENSEAPYEIQIPSYRDMRKPISK